MISTPINSSICFQLRRSLPFSKLIHFSTLNQDDIGPPGLIDWLTTFLNLTQEVTNDTGSNR